MTHLDEASLDAEAHKGPIAWMIRNPVTANLLVLALIVGGLFMAPRIKQEVFPEIELGIVTVTVPYPGASPSEVEQGVILAIEEGVRGLDGVKEVRSVARESVGSVTVELEPDADPDKGLNDIKGAVDRISTFPQDAERPIVQLAIGNRSEVLSLIVHGPQSEEVLRQAAEQVRDGLLQDERVTLVELGGVRPREISVEVPQEQLRRHGLTLDDISARIRAASIELPGGSMKTQSGEILIRTDERRDLGDEYANIELRSDASGSTVKLGEIAQIRDGFADTDLASYYNGEPAIAVRVFRIGEQTPNDISEATYDYIEANAQGLPPGISLDVWGDRSEQFRDRMKLMVTDGLQGLVLVLLVLGLFMEIKLAFWVTLGMPVSFLGALFLLPHMDVSINMISMFAFIVVLGMVVDDAIVIGESVYTWRQKGVSLVDAAVLGTKEVFVPVVFSVLCTVAAFSPLLFLPGSIGKIFWVIPVVVITVLLIDVTEAILILPAHLAHSTRPTRGLVAWLNSIQGRFARLMERFAEVIYQPALMAAIRWRYWTVTITFAAFLLSVGVLAGGRVDFTFFPKVDGDTVTAQARMPVGTPLAETLAMRQRLEASLTQVIAESGGEKIVRGRLTQIGASISGGGPGGGGTSGGGAEVLDVAVFMVPVDQRPKTSTEIANRWRQLMGDVAGVRSLTYRFNIGPGSGLPVDVQLSHRDNETLSQASERMVEILRNYQGVKDIENSFNNGKPQWNFTLTSEGKALGLTEQLLARQLRSDFFGAEAVRQQRGRDEVRTLVRLPEQDRRTEHTLDGLLLRTPRGAEVPLSVAADRTLGRAPSEIRRTDGRRVVSVTADVDEKTTNANKVLGTLKDAELAALLEEFPGLTYTFGGQQKEQRETLASLQSGMLLALVLIFALLAVPLKSYFQPLIIMSMIPMGLVGSLIGHILLGYGFSIMSIMGVVALMGVVVNDSLVLLDAINQHRQEGMSPLEAARNAGVRRFRPIFLTSSTTFLGLGPLVLETSVQARFLIPMGISLAFGVGFATTVALFQVPALYMIGQDLLGLLGKLKRAAGLSEEPAPQDEAQAPTPELG